MTLKELETKYNEQANKRKMKIRLDDNRFRRFFKWVWYFISFPFVWLFYNIRDWRTFVIFAIVVVVVGIEVWLPLLLGFITWGTPFSKVMFSVAGVCEIFWLGPGTPFMLICTFLTIFIKGIFNKIMSKRAIAKHPKE